MIFEGQQSRIWTALPGIVASYDAGAHTCSVQPAINGTQQLPSGEVVELKMPLLLDCPVVFPGGGGVTLTFPIKSGDECLVVFSSRCIDAWWQLGGVQGQAKFRMHSLSDGFVIPGGRSQPRAFGANTATAQLRTDDGAAFIEIDPESHEVRVETTSSITMTAPVVTINAPSIVLNGQVTQGKGSNGGTMQLQGPVNVVDDVIAGGKSLINHKHDVKNVQGGSATIASEKPT